MAQIVGILIGIISGVVWEVLATTPFKTFSTLFPSQFINGKYHLHHWIWYFLLLLIVIFWSFKTGKLFHPAVLMILSFLLAALIYNFIKFPDWHQFMR